MLNKFKIGHASDQEKGTGVTVIIAEEGAVGGVSIRGNAPGTRETDLLKSDALVQKINAVVLTGGSAFGLESTCGVMKYLSEKGIGYNTGAYVVPIVCGAVLYDLEYKEFGYPDIAMGYQAAEAAIEDNYNMGDIGAGTGATVGKIMGTMLSEKSGLGVATAKYDDVEIMAVVAVNAFGDVYDYKSNTIIRGAKSEDGYLNTCSLITSGIEIDKRLKNTTIGCILTNAKISKAQANKLADQVHNAYALCIRPVHTMVDGDTIFTMSSGDVDTEFIQLAEASIQVMSQAIINAVTK